jgi:YD repeat-containing protein
MTASLKFVTRLLALVLVLACAQQLCAQSQSIQYYYDDLGRLVKMVDPAGDVVTYVYDAVGNILQIQRSTISQGQLAIFDFNPQEGPIGISVTIRGQGFNANPTLDVVKFNGRAATVTSATTTVLVAIVPAGATTGPISVTVQFHTVTTPNNFVVIPLPVIQTVWPKSALFSAAIPNAQVTGANLLGANFFFNPSGPMVNAVSVDPSGTSATMTFSAGTTAGTFALVASDAYGNSSTIPTAANRFTVVNPISTADTDGDGIPDVVEATYGTDPLDPNSFPTASSLPIFGESDSLFSVLNMAGGGSQTGMNEVDGIVFSVVNADGGGGIGTLTNEVDGIPFSVVNADGGGGIGTLTNEVDGIPFSVVNLDGTSGIGTGTNETDAIIFSVCNYPCPQHGGSGPVKQKDARVKPGERVVNEHK